LNPGSVADTLYFPGSKEGRLYTPDSLVRARLSTPVFMFTAVIATPGIKAFEESSTVPLIAELT